MPPPTSYSAASNGSPPSITDAFAVVPPMSKVIASGRSSRAASACAAMTPAAGPDSISCTGRLRATVLVSSPPADCMMSSGAVTPAPARPRSSAST